MKLTKVSIAEENIYASGPERRPQLAFYKNIRYKNSRSFSEIYQMIQLLPCVMPDLIGKRVLVLEFRKPMSVIRPGQPVKLERVAEFSEEEAEGKTTAQLIEEAEKRFVSCSNDLWEVLSTESFRKEKAPA